MADSILRLKVESSEYDNKLKRATEGIRHLADVAHKGAGEMTGLDKAEVEYIKSLGSMETKSRTAAGSTRELENAFKELKSIYNQLNDVEKADEGGKALAQSLETIKRRAIEAKKQLADISKELGDMPSGGGGGMFSGLSDKLSGALQVFGGNLMTKGAGILAGLATEMGDAITQGIELAKQGEGIRIAFERLGRGDILDGLRKATHGTVTDIELMKAAVKFNDFKLPVEELGTMLAFAQQKAKDTGQSVDYMVDSIVTGLGRKSLMILDNLGLSAAEVKEKMAETGDMTKAVGEIIRQQMQAAGDYVETAADRAAQANVSLQNKMEELGRKFAPLEEASSQLWTSMKIGILDVVGGPLTKLLNGLTEAGRLRNMLNDMNGESGSGNTKVDQQLTTLRAIRQSGGSDYLFRSKLAEMVEDYNRQIIDLDTQIKNGGKKPDAGSGESRSVVWLQRQSDALAVMRDQLREGAEEITKPQKIEIDTSSAEQSIDSLKGKLTELEAQRKIAIKAGDTEKSQTLTKQINQVKADIRGLDPTVLSTSTTRTKSQQAEEQVKSALLSYQQTIDKARLEMESGLKGEADVKQATLSAKESLYDAYGKAYATYADPKYKEAQDKTAGEIIKLGGEVKDATEQQKRVAQAARELENAKKKLATAQTELTTAREGGKLKEMYAAEKKVTTAQQEVTRLETVKVNVEQGKIDLPDVPTDDKTIHVNVAEGTVDLPDVPSDDKTIHVNILASTDNIDAAVAHLKEQLGGLQAGSQSFERTRKSLVDMTTLQTVVNEQVKRGVTIDSTATQGFMSQILNGGDIDDATWQTFVDGINERLRNLDIDPITIDFNTGSIKKETKEMEKEWQAAGSAIQAVGSAMSQIEDPAAKVVGTVAQAIATMALSYANAANSPAVTSSGWGWIAFAATGVATMVSSIAAIRSATKGYADGGVVSGNSFSGDNTYIRANAGELILNRAAQSNLAQQFEGAGLQNLQLETRIQAEDVKLILTNNGKRTGKGEYVQSRNIRSGW